MLFFVLFRGLRKARKSCYLKIQRFHTLGIIILPENKVNGHLPQGKPWTLRVPQQAAGY